MDFQKQLDMLTVIEESTDFDNSNMFLDDNTADISIPFKFEHNKQYLENYSHLLQHVASSKELRSSLPPPSQELQEAELFASNKQSFHSLEESTYNSFLSLFENSNSSNNISNNVASNRYSHVPVSAITTNSKEPSLILGSSASVPYSSSDSTMASEKHFSTSAISTMSGSTYISNRSDGNMKSYKPQSRFSIKSQVIYKPASKPAKSKRAVEEEEDRLSRSMINLEFYDLTSEDYNGVPFNFSLLFDKVVMIVNVASHCHFTPQYKELEKLYEKYNSKGFEIIAFPSNQFLQEPATETEIVQSCSLKFNVSFPIMKKIRVNGKKTSPIYEYLKSQKKGWFLSKRVVWNFEKFLVDRRGNVVDRATAFTKPTQFEEIIVKLLDE